VRPVDCWQTECGRGVVSSEAWREARREWTLRWDWTVTDCGLVVFAMVK